MSRVINPDTAGKERKKLTRAIVLAIREFLQQSEINDNSRDLAAFIILSLNRIYEGVDISVAAWEKRGYWVKADKYRMTWEWTNQHSIELKKAVFSNDWGAVVGVCVKIAQRLSDIHIPARHRIGKPWIGAWDELLKSQ